MGSRGARAGMQHPFHGWGEATRKDAWPVSGLTPNSVSMSGEAQARGAQWPYTVMTPRILQVAKTYLSRLATCHRSTLSPRASYRLRQRAVNAALSVPLCDGAAPILNLQGERQSFVVPTASRALQMAGAGFTVPAPVTYTAPCRVKHGSPSNLRGRVFAPARVF